MVVLAVRASEPRGLLYGLLPSAQMTRASVDSAAQVQQGKGGKEFKSTEGLFRSIFLHIFASILSRGPNVCHQQLNALFF